jgi:hypothetical protein
MEMKGLCAYFSDQTAGSYDEYKQANTTQWNDE